MGGWGGGGRGANPKNCDEKINVGMIDHANAEYKRLLEGSGSMLPLENFEI